MKERVHTPSEIKALLSYDPLSGDLRWKDRLDARPSVRSRLNGALALTNISTLGYKRGRVMQVSYQAHVIAWVIFYGTWPDREIDHINTIKTDNRIKNLRLATRSENNRNKPVRSDSSIGLKGVTFHPQTGKWRARISCFGKTNSLGLFASPEEAHCAYRNAMEKFHGKFARSR